MIWYRQKIFFKVYGLLPHAFINCMAGWLCRLQNPPWIIRKCIQKWNDRMEEGIALSEFEFKTIEAFFLRDISAGRRPFSPGFMSPVDGILMARGNLENGTMIQAKGQFYSLHKLITEDFYNSEPDVSSRGSYYTLFLTPGGYHGVHMPEDGTFVACQWVPGRYFPQNEDAVKYIPRIYEKNERLVLKIQNMQGRAFFLVMVGASLIGGIYLRDVPKAAFQKSAQVKVDKYYEKGARIGHFTFGSTVILILPTRTQEKRVLPDGSKVKMGETLT